MRTGEDRGNTPWHYQTINLGRLAKHDSPRPTGWFTRFGNDMFLSNHLGRDTAPPRAQSQWKERPFTNHRRSEGAHPQFVERLQKRMLIIFDPQFFTMRLPKQGLSAIIRKRLFWTSAEPSFRSASRRSLTGRYSK
jgi:hypothetical protein